MVLRSIQVCRGLAALVVMAFHICGAIAADHYFGFEVFRQALGFGMVGVEFFFVLSGFIIVYVHADDFGRPERLRPYLRNRFERLYPVYWLIFAAVFALALMSPGARATLPDDPLVILKSLLLLPQHPDVAGGSGAPVIKVAWTLQYELLFYLFVGLLIWNVRLAALMCALLAAAVALAVYSGASIGDWLPILYPRYFLLFALGMAAAAAVRHDVVQPSRPVAVVGGAILVVFCALDVAGRLLSGVAMPDPLIQTLGYGLGSSLLVAGLASAELKGWKVSSPRGVLLGEASYVLYLLHVPVISVTMKVLMALGIGSLGMTGAWLSVAILTIACIASALAVHMMMERPLMRFLRDRREAAWNAPLSAPQPADRAVAAQR